MTDFDGYLGRGRLSRSTKQSSVRGYRIISRWYGQEQCRSEVIVYKAMGCNCKFQS